MSDDYSIIGLLTQLKGGAGVSPRFFVDPAGEGITEVTSLRSYFSDDFGGAALDTTTRWDDYNGGLGAVQQTSGAQAAIGTGTTGITYSVASSALTVTMGTTNAAERWLLSKAMFCGSEDILIILSRSQALAANMIQIGLVEVDPLTGYPILNPNLAADFTNRVTAEFGQTASATIGSLRTVSDSSPAETSVALTAPASMTTAFETLLQVRAEDVHALTAVIDTSAAKVNATRISSQVPNDTRVYKLLMRFKNVSAPGSSTTVTISRVMVQNHQAVNVAIGEASGSNIGSQGLPVTLVNSIPTGSTMALVAGSALIGRVTNNSGFAESSSTLTSGQTFTGTGHATTSLEFASKFGATAYADVAGTLYIDISTDTGGSYQEVASAPLTAGTVGFRGDLSIPVRGAMGAATLYRVRFINGGTGQATFRCASSFTAA